MFINSPTSNTTYTTNSSTLNISGTASDNFAVSLVTWSNSRGGSGTCTGTSSWSKSAIELYEGTNVIQILAQDAAGNTGTDTLTVTYVNSGPSISNARVDRAQVKYPSCSLWGPEKLGTYFTIKFDYTDSNGNFPITSSEAQLYCEWDFIPGTGDFAQDTSAFPSGDGFSGTVTYYQCIGFAANPSVDVTMTIKDLLGAASNSLKLNIKKPEGAN